MDCNWIEKNLEALLSETLDPETERLARTHIEACQSCKKEVDALRAIDPLVKAHFHRELAIARAPRVTSRVRVFGLSSAAVAVVALVLFVGLHTSQNPPPPLSASQPQIPPAVATDAPAPAKDTTTSTEADRAKPVNEPVKPADRNIINGAAAVDDRAPDFLVIDPAGYSHKLEDYRGHVVVVGVWDRNTTEGNANFERLYKAHGPNPKFRFLGVANTRLAKPAKTTFPIVYNQGSKLFGAKAGEFVLLNEDGSVQARGSLTKDFDTLQKLLQKN